MSWADLLWFPPLILAVAMVLGSAGSQGWDEMRRSVLHAFVYLSIGVAGVGIVIHVVAHVFSG